MAHFATQTVLGNCFENYSRLAAWRTKFQSTVAFRLIVRLPVDFFFISIHWFTHQTLLFIFKNCFEKFQLNFNFPNFRASFYRFLHIFFLIYSSAVFLSNRFCLMRLFEALRRALTIRPHGFHWNRSHYESVACRNIAVITSKVIIAPHSAWSAI